MKKLFTLLVSAMVATASFATDYTDNLTVTVDGKAMPTIQSTISVTENTDGSLQVLTQQLQVHGSVTR